MTIAYELINTPDDADGGLELDTNSAGIKGVARFLIGLQITIDYFNELVHADKPCNATLSFFVNGECEWRALPSDFDEDSAPVKEIMFDLVVDALRKVF